jgi:GAF domain-containing protein
MSERKPDTSEKSSRPGKLQRLGVSRITDPADNVEQAVSTVQSGWRRFISVGGVPARPADILAHQDGRVRRGELLNTLVVAATLVVLGLLLVLEVARRRGYLTTERGPALIMAFPVAILLLGAVCFWLCKRGRIELAIRLYVWITLVAVIAAAGLVNGYRSASWLLVIWPVVLGGSLLGPFVGLAFAIGALAAYGWFGLAQAVGWYTPLLPTALEGFPFLSLAFGWLMIVVAVGLVNAINGASLRSAFDQLSRISRALDESQRELSVRVAERTSELQTRAEQFRAIAELGQAASSMSGAPDTDPDAFLKRAVDLISERLGFYHVGIFLLDRERQWAVLRAASSVGGQRMVLRGHRLRIGTEGIVGYVAEKGVPRYAFHVDEDAAWVGNPDLPDTKSEIALPLIIGERVIGVLDMQTHQPAAFGEPDLLTFWVLADSVAVAFENGRLFQETQEAIARLQRYQSEDAIAAWRQALARRHMQVGFSYASGETQPVGSTGNGKPVSGLDIAAAPGSAPDGQPDLSALQGVTQVLGDNGDYLLLAPVSAGGTRLGALTFQRSSPWSDEAVRLVASVVDQLDLALSNARLLEETRLRARQEAARSEIVGRIRAMTSTDAILRNAAEELGRALQVERSRVQLVQFADAPSGDG